MWGIGEEGESHARVRAVGHAAGRGEASTLLRPGTGAKPEGKQLFYHLGNFTNLRCHPLSSKDDAILRAR
jgi:hypothetical protein